MIASRKFVRIVLRNIENFNERFRERQLAMTNTEAYVALRLRYDQQFRRRRPGRIILLAEP